MPGLKSRKGYAKPAFKFGDKVRFWEDCEWKDCIFVDLDRSLPKHVSSNDVVVVQLNRKKTDENSCEFWYPYSGDLYRGWKKCQKVSKLTGRRSGVQGVG